ncbi:type II secretion system protein [Pseudaeromonas sharmana]|uniref:Type II secretion system protein n=1 Tax=Pseudaeromonas sharmana TaxID=328412 RepID=A0ABV8CJV2_9GAMM
MQRQNGFTLIELVIVIVLLGILAVVAAPKFLDLQADARVSSLNGVKAAVQSAASMVYDKAVIAGVENASAAVVTITPGQTVRTVYGYPNGQDLFLLLDISASSAVNATGVDFIYASLDTAPNTIGIWPVGGYASASSRETKCNVTYIDATASGALPLITTYSGC